MANLKFDELNVLKEIRAYRAGNFDKVSTEVRKIIDALGVKSEIEVENDIYDWFSVMGIPSVDIDNRVKLACRFEDSFIETLIFLYVMHEADDGTDKTEMERMFYTDYGKAIEGFLSNSNAFKREDTLDRKFSFSEFVTNTTGEKPNEANTYSEERAVTMAVTESAVLLADADYKKALSQGCTRKSWNTIIDGKEREWHYEADGQDVPIESYFLVDGELMRHPHDQTASARNLVNCRCWCTYS